MADKQTDPTTLVMADLLQRLVQLQEAQPQPQIPITKAKIATPWNPEGKLKRPELKRKTFLNNHPLQEMMMHEEEIHLANQLKPGKYQNNQWLVVHTDGEGESEMFIYVPNKTAAHRMEMAAKAPTFAALCQLIIAEQKAPKAVVVESE